MAKQFRHIGKYAPRIDGRAIVTGAAQYSNDVSMHGMLYGFIKMSPHANAIIRSIDASRALELPACGQ